MKKRIGLILGLLVFVLSFTGCTSNVEDKKVDNTELYVKRADGIVQMFSSMDDEALDAFSDISEFELNATLLNYGVPAEGDEFLSMIESWKAGEKECGEFVKHGDYTIEEKKKETVLTTDAEFENRDAKISVVFDNKGNFDSFTVDAKYSTGEILKKAGLNTVLGMGTVFSVLIFLAFIISLFKFIPNGDNKKTKKSEAPKTLAAPVVSQEAEEVSDDLELIAVIAAAIAASEGTSTDDFVVRSIKRRKTNKWN